MNSPVAVEVAGFEGLEFFVIGQQAAVVVERGDDFGAVAQEGVTEALLDPFGAFARTGAA